MKISFNWLREFVDIAEDPRQFGRRITDVGLAVDAIEQMGDDSIFELDVATNRPDCLSHLGVAREAGAIYGSSLRRPEFQIREDGPNAASVVSISISDADLCPR